MAPDHKKWCNTSGVKEKKDPTLGFLNHNYLKLEERGRYIAGAYLARVL